MEIDRRAKCMHLQEHASNAEVDQVADMASYVTTLTKSIRDEVAHTDIVPQQMGVQKIPRLAGMFGLQVG